MKVYVLYINQKLDIMLQSIILNKFEKINPHIKNLLDREWSKNRTAMYIRIPEDQNVLCGMSENTYNIHSINYFNRYRHKKHNESGFLPPETKASEIIRVQIHDLI